MKGELIKGAGQGHHILNVHILGRSVKVQSEALPQSAKEIYNTDGLCDVTHLLQLAPVLYIEDMCLM